MDLLVAADDLFSIIATVKVNDVKSKPKAKAKFDSGKKKQREPAAKTKSKGERKISKMKKDKIKAHEIEGLDYKSITDSDEGKHKVKSKVVCGYEVDISDAAKSKKQSMGVFNTE